MHESSMSELVDTGNQQSNKEVDWQKVFYVFWKYKNTKIFSKVYLNSILYFKYVFYIHVFAIMPIPANIILEMC